MRNLLIWFILAIVLISFGCSGETRPASPLETFKTYAKAIKKQDITAMKLLLSQETLKMHEQEAKSQGVTVDDIVKRESLFSENQTSVEFRNEKIDENKATLEVKDSIGYWQTVYFVFEDGEWKIDKKSSADELMHQIEQENKQADEQFNSNRPFEEPANSSSPADPSSSPTRGAEPINANRASINRTQGEIGGFN